MTKTKVLSGVLSAVLVTGVLVFGQPSYGHAQVKVPVNIQMSTVVANVQKTVDAKKAKPGEAFTVKIVTGTTLNDGTVVPIGSILEGHVDSATKSEHHSDSTLVLTIDKLKLKDGKEIQVKATIVQVASFEKELGNDSGQPHTGPFENNKKDSAMMNSSLAGHGASSGPHPVPGLTLTSSVNDPTSGTLTQKRDNVRLSNENQIQVSVAVVPKGMKLP